jgi:hypothetical protein
MTSALVGGAGTLLASGVLANAKDSEVENACDELTAADPLSLYSQMVRRLQPAAIKAIRVAETVIQESQTDKLQELWALSDRLKEKLPKNSITQSAVERVNSLAYIGRTNAHAMNSGLISRSRESFSAHAKSQRLVISEILKTSANLARGDVKISAEAWSLLQEILRKIGEIRSYQPKVNKARDEFNKAMDSINGQMESIQSALMGASTSLVKGDKAGATAQVRQAIAIVKALPGYEESPSDAGKNVVTKSEADVFTAKKFVELLDPGIFHLIDGTQSVPTVSRKRSMNSAAGFSLAPVAYVRGSEPSSSSPFDPQTVKGIVTQCLQSGSWWQVVGVAAACLPLWSYPQSEHRKSLIYSALSAIPRGPNSRLWEAAYFLNRLRS